MKDIEVYMEGGGSTAASRGLLRAGAEALVRGLRVLASEKGMEVRVICCGGRREAHSRFAAARARAYCRVLLLVDSEEPVEKGAREHLVTQDTWNDLASLPAEDIHLMVQVMETWLVADRDALRRYYGPGLRARELPVEYLEGVPKADILESLARATAHARKGSYQKIGHGADLLARIDAEKVRARCPHCERLFAALTRMIEAA